MGKMLISKLSEFVVTHGLTYEQVARDIGVSQATVCRWINGGMGIGNRNKHKVTEYLKNWNNKKEKNSLSFENWPLTEVQLQQVINYLSNPNNRLELFEFLAKIERFNLNSNKNRLK
ncbi:MAG: helix-turn-helix transcriptional regulator [Lentisphaerae bacterium]|nr:helix-turn-helix transcriptional regulator [Lentisphaerota bacterium]MCP4103242.1 helix-turn-helix transcriptional regulator [Lentisphaerota bacterium]